MISFMYCVELPPQLPSVVKKGGNLDSIENQSYEFAPVIISEPNLESNFEKLSVITSLKEAPLSRSNSSVAGSGSSAAGRDSTPKQFYSNKADLPVVVLDGMAKLPETLSALPGPMPPATGALLEEPRNPILYQEWGSDSFQDAEIQRNTLESNPYDMSMQTNPYGSLYMPEMYPDSLLYEYNAASFRKHTSVYAENDEFMSLPVAGIDPDAERARRNDNLQGVMAVNIMH
jgi:hypothetical protein